MSEQEFTAGFVALLQARSRSQAVASSWTMFGQAPGYTEYVLTEFDLPRIAAEVWLESGIKQAVEVGNGQYRLITEILLKWTDRCQAKQDLAQKIVEALQGDAK